MTRERLGRFALLLALVLLPWQTRWIVVSGKMDGLPWEYGTVSLYAAELLVLASAALYGRLRLGDRSRFAIPLSWILLACAFSSVFTPIPAVALGATFHAAMAALLFLLLLDERTDATQALTAFVVGLIPAALLGWDQVIAGSSFPQKWLGLAGHDAATLGQSVVESAAGERTLRAYGPFPHPNVFGGFLAVGLWALAVLASRLRDHARRHHLALPAMLLAATLVITFSRGAWLAAALSLGFVVAALMWHGRLRAHAGLPLIWASLLALVITMLVFHTQLFTRFTPGARLEARSLAERSASYREAPEAFAISPVTGVGPSLYTLALSTFRPGAPAYEYQPVHNAFLLYLVEVGLVGLFASLPFLRRGWKAVNGIHVRSERVFALSGTVLLITLGLFDHYLWSLWAGLSLAAVAGASVVRGKG